MYLSWNWAILGRFNCFLHFSFYVIKLKRFYTKKKCKTMFSALQQRPQAQWFPEMLAFMFSGPGLSHKLWLIVRQQEYPLSKELNKIQILCSNNKKKKNNSPGCILCNQENWGFFPVTWTSTVAVNMPWQVHMNILRTISKVDPYVAKNNTTPSNKCLFWTTCILVEKCFFFWLQRKHFKQLFVTGAYAHHFTMFYRGVTSMMQLNCSFG